MEVLKKNKHRHSLIYMRGIKEDTLVTILDFLYFGETNVEQENLEAFLALAEELRLKGLTGPSNETKYDFEELPQKKIPQIKLQTESVPNEETPMDFHRLHKEKAFPQKCQV